MAWASVRCITALLSVVLAALAALSVEGQADALFASINQPPPPSGPLPPSTTDGANWTTKI